MTKKELWEKLAKMKGRFGMIQDAVRHKRKRTVFEVECCPLSALDRSKGRTNNPVLLAPKLGLPLDFAREFATAADFPLGHVVMTPERAKLRKKILRTLGLKEST